MQTVWAPTLAKTNVAIDLGHFVCCLSAAAMLGLSTLGALAAPDGAPAKAEPAKKEAPKIEPAAAKPARTEAASAEAAKPTAPAPDVAAKTEAPQREPASTEAQAGVKKYCVNIAAAATDARFSWQSQKLLEVEVRIKARIAELDAKQAELKGWLDRREAINKQAKETLVGIYAKMKPETAAAQIAALDDDMATAVLAALTPRQASAIFNEITPADRAAKLAGLLATPSASANDKKL
jgi:flagellar motility protein MotE (MotC chaperone)